MAIWKRKLKPIVKCEEHSRQAGLCDQCRTQGIGSFCQHHELRSKCREGCKIPLKDVCSKCGTGGYKHTYTPECSENPSPPCLHGSDQNGYKCTKCYTIQQKITSGALPADTAVGKPTGICSHLIRKYDCPEHSPDQGNFCKHRWRAAKCPVCTGLETEECFLERAALSEQANTDTLSLFGSVFPAAPALLDVVAPPESLVTDALEGTASSRLRGYDPSLNSEMRGTTHAANHRCRIANYQGRGALEKGDNIIQRGSSEPACKRNISRGGFGTFTDKTIVITTFGNKVVVVAATREFVEVGEHVKQVYSNLDTNLVTRFAVYAKAESILVKNPIRKINTYDLRCFASPVFLRDQNRRTRMCT